jgi:hypothetical protein
MRTERCVPDWWWQVVIAGVLASSCRWVATEPVHDRAGVVFDSARQASRGPADEWPDREYTSPVPVLECVEALGRGELRAHFGYENNSEDELHVPIGDHNKFRPWPKDRDQPIDFKAGAHERVVSVTFEDSERVTWVLEGEEAWADSDSPRCKHDSHSDPAKPPAKPACDSCDGSRGSPKDENTRNTSPPAPDAGIACDDAGAAPSDAAVGDKRCPESTQFAASCVGALHCGPYQGPLQAKCSRSCCSHPETFTVPLPTIAECIDGRWAFSVAPDDSTDACDVPHACDCPVPAH